jgi:hypothetical protein
MAGTPITTNPPHDNCGSSGRPPRTLQLWDSSEADTSAVPSRDSRSRPGTRSCSAIRAVPTRSRNWGRGRPRRGAGRPRRTGDIAVVTVPSRRSPTWPPRHWRGRRSSTRATTAPSVTGRSPSSTTSRSPPASCCCRTCRTRWSVNAFNKILRPVCDRDRRIARDRGEARATTRRSRHAPDQPSGPYSRQLITSSHTRRDHS